jgi:peptidoglycan/xylan/chitin deacetylase (PgdA/CDA1 family)
VNAGGTLVLLYHRVARLERDPHGLAVRPDRFAQHCEILQRRFSTIPLSDWNRSGRHVAITFDDGYADNALEARGILAAAGLPATFFITVGPLGERREA